MPTEIFQALLVAVLSYLGWLGTPWLGGAPIGWYVLGRPLIAGTIVGFVYGDPVQGAIIGATINAFYIGAITPGGAMAADMNFAGYVGAAVALSADVTPEQAVALAVPLGLLGTLGWQAFSTLNTGFAHVADRHVEQGSFAGFYRSLLLYPQLLAFAVRVIPAFVFIYLGQAATESIVNAMPPVLEQSLNVVGAILPAVGLAVLLKMLVRDLRFLPFFLFGFLAVALGMTLTTVAALALGLGIIHSLYRGGPGRTDEPATPAEATP